MRIRRLRIKAALAAMVCHHGGLIITGSEIPSSFHTPSLFEALT